MRLLALVHQPDAGPGVFAEPLLEQGHELVGWTPPVTDPPALDGVDAVMVFGGAMHVDQEDAHPWLRTEKAWLRGPLAQGVPALGVCLGAQLLAEAAGAAPRRALEPEIGWHPIELTDEGAADPLFGALPRRFEGFSWHSYEAPLPPGAVALARSELCLQGFRLPEGRGWGIQFHPEVSAPDLHGWLDGWDTDEDAVRVGIDPDALRAESERRLEAWNELGRGLARRFARAVAARAAA